MGRHGQRNHLCHLLGPIGTSASPVCSDLEQPESQCWKGVKGGCIGYISILSWSNKMLGLWNHNKKMQVYQLHSWFCYWIILQLCGAYQSYPHLFVGYIHSPVWIGCINSLLKTYLLIIFSFAFGYIASSLQCRLPTTLLILSSHWHPIRQNLYIQGLTEINKWFAANLPSKIHGYISVPVLCTIVGGFFPLPLRALRRKTAQPGGMEVSLEPTEKWDKVTYRMLDI